MRVAIAEDHVEVRTALRLLFGLSKEIEIVFEAEDGLEAIELVKLHQPDVLVMDIRMPGLSGLEATKQIVAQSIPTHVILISTLEGKAVIKRAKNAGAKGFVPKGDVVGLLLTAIETVGTGGQFFSEV